MDGTVTILHSLQTQSQHGIDGATILRFQGAGDLFSRRPWVPFYTHPCQHFLCYTAGGNVNYMDCKEESQKPTKRSTV